MKNYYYCNANFSVYTENEKNNSRCPGCRFELIGCFKNRAQAEAAIGNGLDANYTIVYGVKRS